MLESEARKLSLEEYDSLDHTSVVAPQQGTDATV
jgi:hypothetical protein